MIDDVNCGTVDPVIIALWGQIAGERDWAEREYGNQNNHSLALRVEFGEASILFTGDMEEIALAELVALYATTNLLDTDVYHVGHHGSINGTTEALFAAVTPHYAVISMGPATREISWTAWQYGHPRREVLELLEQRVVATRAAMTVSAGRGSRKFRSGDVTVSVIPACLVELGLETTGPPTAVAVYEQALGQLNVAQLRAERLDQQLSAAGDRASAQLRAEQRQADAELTSSLRFVAPEQTAVRAVLYSLNVP